MSHLDLGNGLTETRPYTNRYFPSAISVDPTAPLAGSPVLQWTYGTDNVGNILSIDDTLTPANDKAYAYQDHQYFLTGGTGPWGALAWTYDQIGNRLTETRDGVTDSYAYTSNGTGNTALLSTVTLGLGGTRGYTYGPAGHLEQVTAPANQINFLSDAAGRLTRLERPAGDARSDFLYDGRSFLRWAEASPYSTIFTDGFETGDGSCWTLAEGSDINAGTATCPRGPQLDSVYSSEGLLHTVTHRPSSGPTSTRYYLYLAGRPVAQLDIDPVGIATPTWLTTDHLGTPVLATDAAGSVLWQGGFEPFGADYSGAGAAGVDLRFPGQWVDGVWEDAGEGAGVVYNLYRWYQPDLATYSRPDPLGFLDGDRNALAYGASNPVLNVDMLGLVCSSTAAAYVCCDGAGGFAVCTRKLPHDEIRAKCILAHEQDHVSWYSENASCQCQGREAGHCEFRLTKSNHNSSECRGYRIEWRCLRTARKSAAGPVFERLIARQRQLMSIGKKRYGCNVKEWGK